MIKGIKVCFLLFNFVMTTASLEAVGKTIEEETEQLCPCIRDYFRKAYTYQQNGQFNEAISFYRTVVTIMPGTGLAYSNLGYCLKEIGKYEEAVVNLQRAISSRPDLVEARQYLDEINLKMGDLNKAKQEYDIKEGLGAEKADGLLEETELDQKEQVQ